MTKVVKVIKELRQFLGFSIFITIVLSGFGALLYFMITNQPFELLSGFLILLVVMIFSVNLCVMIDTARYDD